MSARAGHKQQVCLRERGALSIPAIHLNSFFTAHISLWRTNTSSLTHSTILVFKTLCKHNVFTIKQGDFIRVNVFQLTFLPKVFILQSLLFCRSKDMNTHAYTVVELDSRKWQNNSHFLYFLSLQNICFLELPISYFLLHMELFLSKGKTFNSVLVQANLRWLHERFLMLTIPVMILSMHLKHVVKLC